MIWNNKILNFGIHLGGLLPNKHKFSDYFASGSRENFLIFNVDKLINNLFKLNKLILNITNKQGQFFFVETRCDLGFKEITQNASLRCQSYFIGEWSYGTITNKSMNDLYITKKTKNSITTDLNIAFISNIGYNVTVAKEIEKLFIPIIGITDSSSNYWNHPYPIVGNSRSILSLFFFCTFLELTTSKAIFNFNTDCKNKKFYHKYIWDYTNKYKKRKFKFKKIITIL